MDYVIKADRGKAYGYTVMGVCIGVLLSLNALYAFTRKLDPLISWSIMGSLYVFIGIICIICIREPVDIEKKESSVLQQMKDLTVNVCKAIKKNPNLLIGWFLLTLFSSPKIIFEVYLISWLESEVKNGHFPDEDSKAHYYQL
jgi:MFS family permease